MTKVAAIVQARMGSTRLPGKVLAPVGARTVLGHVLARLERCVCVDTICVATTSLDADDTLAAAAAALGAHVVRGPADDVLARYVQAARCLDADVIVRVTADCPLIDPTVVDDVVIAAGATPRADYASNTHRRSFPRGLDAEALHREVLERIDGLARTPATREHVTSYVLEHPGAFRIRQVVAPRDDSDLRLTVDTADDLALIRALDRALDLGRLPATDEVIAHLRAHPELIALNAHVEQKPWTGAACA